MFGSTDPSKYRCWKVLCQPSTESLINLHFEYDYLTRGDGGIQNSGSVPLSRYHGGRLALVRNCGMVWYRQRTVLVCCGGKVGSWQIVCNIVLRILFMGRQQPTEFKSPPPPNQCCLQTKLSSSKAHGCATGHVI